MKKTYVMLCMLMIASLATAQLAETTSDNTVVLISANETASNQTTPVLEQTTTTLEQTTTTLPVPTLYEELNSSLGQSESIDSTGVVSIIPPNTTPVIIENTSIEDVTQTTATIPQETSPPTTIKPECGNLYQEVGEECDTTPSSCGAGRWECKDCKCITLPDEPTTTTEGNRTIAGIKIPSLPSDIDTDKLILYGLIAVGVILVVVFLLYKMGSNGEEHHETKLQSLKK